MKRGVPNFPMPFSACPFVKFWKDRVGCTSSSWTASGDRQSGTKAEFGSTQEMGKTSHAYTLKSWHRSPRHFGQEPRWKTRSMRSMFHLDFLFASILTASAR
jgi:hypothetical protein